MRREKIKPVWVQLAAGGGTADYFWDRLVTRLYDKKQQLGETLGNLGFPSGAPQKSKVIDLFCDEDFYQPFVIVLDDFHLIEDTEVFRLISLIVRQEIKNLHFIIIARDINALSIAELTRLCATVTMETLRFRRDEVEQYFLMMGITASADTLNEITEHTEGWAAMIYLMSLGIKEGRPVSNVNSVYELVERNLFGPCDAETKDILQRLALMDSFTAKQAGYALGREDMDAILRRLHKQNALISYNENDNAYKIHNVLLDFLHERAALPESERRAFYRRIAEWHMKQKSYTDAFAAYRNAGEPEAVLLILNDISRPFIPHALQLALFDLFAEQSREKWFKYPLAFIDYASNLILSGDGKMAAQGMEILDSLTDYYQNDKEFNPNYRDFVLAEIHVCRIFIAFNDADAMVFHMNEASRLLKGGYSALVRRKDEFTFGCPHFLYSYYREAGKLKETAGKMASSFGGFADIADGCGAGCDYLTAAEYALETTDLDSAEMNAFKALHKAGAKEQTCVAACAYFALMRLSLFNGKHGEAHGFFNQLAEEIAKENNPVLNTTLDLIAGYFWGLLEAEERMPEWLRTGDMSDASFMYQGMAWNYIVYEKALLLRGDYIKLDVLCEEHEARFDVFQNQLGHLHNHIHRTAAKLHTDGETAALAELQKALTLGRADNIILPFAENCRHILPLLEAIRETGNGIGEEYLKRVINACKQYHKNNPSRNHAGMILSARETEILLLLRDGLSREEIAEKLVISLATVKTHAANLYRKLGIGNRSAAVKKASDLGLI